MDDALKVLASLLGKRSQEDTWQDGVMWDLSSIITYLREAGVDPRRYTRLVQLVGALADVSCGRASPLLEPGEHDGGARKPISGCQEADI